MEKHHHRLLAFSLLAILIGGGLAGGGYWAYWNFYARFRPTTIATNQVAIQKLLDEADWVSPGRTGAPIYMITYRACADCTAYERDEFPKLAAANVDTRVLAFAPADREGLSQSSATERSTVAELWINRDWNLYARWMAMPRRDWRAEGVRPADGDFARTAVVAATRDWVNQLMPLLKGAGVPEGSPMLIWRDKDGYLKACACTDSRSFHFIRSDLGAPDTAPPVKAQPVPPFAPAPVPTPTAPAAAPQDTPLPVAPAPQAAPQAGPTAEIAPAAGGQASAALVLPKPHLPSVKPGNKSGANTLFY